MLPALSDSANAEESKGTIELPAFALRFRSELRTGRQGTVAIKEQTVTDARLATVYGYSEEKK